MCAPSALRDDASVDLGNVSTGQVPPANKSCCTQREDGERATVADEIDWKNETEREGER